MLWLLAGLPLLREIDALALQHLQSNGSEAVRITNTRTHKGAGWKQRSHMQQGLAALKDLHIRSFRFHNRLVVSEGRRRKRALATIC